jgi:DNA topoisomerase-1
VSNAVVIVESPAKARTISGYLGDDFVVESSIGHIRDLPAGAAQVPAAYKSEKWASMGIDVDNDFKPLYVVSPDKKSHVNMLKKLVQEADELYLATDEDREGEAIAWHLLEVLSPPESVEVKRMVFHEITPEAIQAAIDAPRDIDRRLVDAQEARRLFDRLYGFDMSQVLWRKVGSGLSAGRVQSVAVRIVVARERERMQYVTAPYWGLTATMDRGGDIEPRTFETALIELGGAKVATGRDFGADGAAKADVVVLDESAVTSLGATLDASTGTVRSVEAKPYRRRPAAPFITSTYQQEAGRKLRLSSAMAMRTAQGLYEKGYITYMRTDSTTLSQTALAAARSEIVSRYGKEYCPDEPRVYRGKVKNAQEAHEAIRPAGDKFRTPDQVAAEVPKSEAQVYDLIWKRTIASQMTDAVGETVQVRVAADGGQHGEAVLSASGTVITHQGFRKVYVEGTDDEGDSGQERRLPQLAEGDQLAIANIETSAHETQPPARYTEASLVKRLEELGVGRPSTYAATMGTIQDRGYVWKKGPALVPTFTAFGVVTLLEEHFPQYVDYAFTARMEDELDEIAAGSKEQVPWLSEFYFGTDSNGFKEMVSDLTAIDARAVNTIPLGVDANGELVAARVGKYGPYVERGEDTASIPEDLPPDELTVERAIEFIEAPSADRVLGIEPESGLEIMLKAGRFGPYVQVGEVTEDGPKPATASLFSTMEPESLTFEDSLKLLSLPRVVGVDPADGEEITVQNGRYGPYLKKAKDSRSLASEDQLFTITLEDCLKILAEPKLRRGQTAKPPLREMGDDPVSGNSMTVKDGRFGPYVTDGEFNASLRKGDSVEELSVERAAELLQMRRDRGPAKKTAKKKATKKKSTAKKKKAPAKKKAAKKSAES